MSQRNLGPGSIRLVRRVIGKVVPVPRLTRLVALPKKILFKRCVRGSETFRHLLAERRIFTEFLN